MFFKFWTSATPRRHGDNHSDAQHLTTAIPEQADLNAGADHYLDELDFMKRRACWRAASKADLPRSR
jgi:hypothetical protein